MNLRRHGPISSSLTGPTGTSTINSFMISSQDSQRIHLLNLNLSDLSCCKKVDSTLNKTKKPFIPPNYRHSNEIFKLIKVNHNLI